MSVKIELRVLHLLCSRLCHDLVGPIGAVNNGVELVREFGAEADDEAMDLVADSAKQAAERLKFFRVAYGLAGGTARTFRDARELVGAVIEPGRMTLEWPEDDGINTTALDEGSVKLLLNMILLATEALSPSGSVTVSLTPGPSGVAAKVTAAGARAALEEQTLAGVVGGLDPEELSPRSIQGYYAARLAQDQGTDLSVDSSDGSVSVSANLRLGAE